MILNSIWLQKTPLLQVIDDLSGALFRCHILCCDRNFGVHRYLVGIIDSRKSFDLPAASFGIETFDIPLFTYFQGGIHKYLDKLVFANHFAGFVAGFFVGADGCTDHSPGMAGNFSRYKTDPQDIGIAVFLAETQSF